MASNKKHKHHKYTLVLKPEYDGTIEDIESINIKEYNEKSMGRFGTNILAYRMIPDLRDGLKPIHRRILYAAYFVAYNKKVKSNGIIGELIKRFHPHGDTAAYESMTKLTQDWRGIPLIKGEGNFGSIGDPSSYAAMRYTEAFMSEFSKDCFFSDFAGKDDTSVTDFIPNFDDSEDEPFYLPAKYPVFLFNWNTSVAIGFQSSTPAFSLKDALETTIKLIEEGFNTPVDINIDDPQGCDILAERGVKGKFFDTPNFKIRVRAKYSVESHKNKNYLSITQLPYETSVSSIDSAIKTLVTEKKKINYIEDTDDVVRKYKYLEYSIFLARGYDPHTCMEDLFRKTDLEKTFTLNPLFMNDLKLIDYKTYRNATIAWIEYRREQIKRRTKLRRSKILKEIHIRMALIWLMDNNKVDEFIEIMKKNKSSTAIEIIINKFKFSELQAETLAGLRMSALNPDNQEKYRKDIKEYEKEEKELIEIIHSKKKNIDKIIVKELREGLEKYGEPNRSKIHLIGGAISKTSSTNVEITPKHFLKFSSEQIKSINDDIPFFKGVIPNTFMLAFNDKGNFVNIDLTKIRDSKNNSIGYEFNKFGLDGDCISIIPERTKGSLLFITKNGIIQRSDINKYNDSKTGSAIKLKDGDTLVGCTFAEKNDEVIIVTNHGNSLIISVKDIVETNRNTIGINAINLKEDEVCTHIETLTNNAEYIVSVTDRGYAKKMNRISFPKAERAGKTFNIVSPGDKGNIVRIISGSSSDIMTVYTNFNNESFDIALADLPLLTRLSQSTRAISMPKSVRVVDVKLK